MSLYDFAFARFKGRADVPNIYSMKPKNELKPYTKGMSTKEKFLSRCSIVGRMRGVFESAFMDSFEDENFCDYDCIELSQVSHIPDSTACARAKEVVTEFEAVYVTLTSNKRGADCIILENALLKLFREAVIILETSNDLSTSVLLEDFIESNRSFIGEIVAMRKGENN